MNTIAMLLRFNVVKQFADWYLKTVMEFCRVVLLIERLNVLILNNGLTLLFKNST